MLIFALVYSSVATAAMDRADLESLLTQCRERNERTGVTGMLLYRDGRFMQLLEGAEDVVRDLADRIAEDPRHRDVTTLWSAYDDERQFPDWSMGFRDLEGSGVDLAGYTDVMNRPVTALEIARTTTTGQELLGLFRRFR